MNTTFEFSTKTFSELYNTEQGRKLWQFLNDTVTVKCMQKVSDVGKPALLAVEDELLHDFGICEKNFVEEKDKPQFDRLKQMLGAMARQVMEHNGYKLKASNVKVPNSRIFYSASSYEKN